jgi:protein TonB
MEQRGRTVSGIRCPRGSDPRTFTAEAHRSGYLLAHAEPDYPDEAKAQGIEGKVVLDARIDRNGVIEKPSVRTGHPLLAESALQTVRTWRYRPTKLNGVPVQVETDIEVSFTLPNAVASS